jgi:hypothetical protein
MVAIGVDTGMNHTAMAVRYGDGRETVQSCLRPGTGDLYIARMMHELQRWSNNLCYDEELLVVATERLANMQGAAENNVVLPFAILDGIASTALSRSAEGKDGKVIFLLPTPSQLKKFITGKGVGDKALVGRYIERHWPHAPIEENEGEAYALMQFALCRRAFILGEISRKHCGAWDKYQVETACHDLYSEAKGGKIYHVTFTYDEMADVEKKFQKALTGERDIDVRL